MTASVEINLNVIVNKRRASYEENGNFAVVEWKPEEVKGNMLMKLIN